MFELGLIFELDLWAVCELNWQFFFAFLLLETLIEQFEIQMSTVFAFFFQKAIIKGKLKEEILSKIQFCYYYFALWYFFCWYLFFADPW